jgi:hypothetical protein
MFRNIGELFQYVNRCLVLKGIWKAMFPVIIVAVAVTLYVVGALPIQVFENPQTVTELKPQLKYSVISVCCPTSYEGVETDKVSLDIKDGYIHLEHTILYPCCAEFNVTLDEKSLSQGVIVIKEKNVGGLCRCLCQYVIDIQVGPLPKGKYFVQIWGVEFQDQEPSLRWAEELSIGSEKVCKDMCGDGVCQELVCMAVGCPCPETPATCPIDCKKDENP